MRKFHRERGQRRAFFQGLANNLIMREKIETSVARAKEIRPIVERYVTVAKKQHLAAFRTLLAKLPKQAAEKLYFDIALRYKDRKGGYLRIVKEAKFKKRDGTPLSIIEFVK